MRERRFWLGVFVSGAWLSWMCWQVYCIGLPKALSEQGDFFAGFFAPLAFLWLVIGYLQQGDELRQSTEALKLQAKELKHSVEQQTLLVAASRKQIEQDADALKAEREVQHRRAQPVFSFLLGEALSDGTKTTVHLAVKNSGQLARDVLITQDGDTEIGREAHLPAGENVTATLILTPGQETEVQVSYVDINGSLESVTHWFGVFGGQPQMTSQLWESGE